MVARKLHAVERRMIPSSDRDIRVLILRPRKTRDREKTLPASCGFMEGDIFTACTRRSSCPTPASW